jgi:UDP-N-acetylglucosamine--N-acetylmuramyl-(pentapeptide) pyrophosphoryl-undecaprenol N-acetylglucosamine transferase
MIFIVTGGGTGGHLSIAKALKTELLNRNHQVIFIGSKNGQDIKWFENENGCIEKIFLNSYGVTNRKGLKKILSFFNLIKLAFHLKPVFKKYPISAVISVGGYSSAPASFASIFFRTPLFIHEQNSLIGKLNKILKPFAKEFFSSYLETSKVKDYPIPNVFFQTARIRTEIKTIIFLGGSQGAKFINDFAIKVAPELVQRNIKIIHQTGFNDFTRVHNAYEKLNLDVTLFDFHSNLSDYISQADLAVSRSGASTLWELSANAIPTFFIPYPLANNHQWYNAKFIQDKGLGWLYSQDEVEPYHLFEIIDNADLSSRSKKLKELISPNGAKKVIDVIENILEKK